MNGRRPYLITELDEAEQFTAHLAFAREQGIHVGPLPVSGVWKAGGLYIDPDKADIANYLEARPAQEWRGLVTRGLAGLAQKGIATLKPADSVPNKGAEILDRYTVDYRLILKMTARVPKLY